MFNEWLLRKNKRYKVVNKEKILILRTYSSARFKIGDLLTNFVNVEKKTETKILS